jgi:hypothetical protein
MGGRDARIGHVINIRNILEMFKTEIKMITGEHKGTGRKMISCIL